MVQLCLSSWPAADCICARRTVDGQDRGESMSETVCKRHRNIWVQAGGQAALKQLM